MAPLTNQQKTVLERALRQRLADLNRRLDGDAGDGRAGLAESARDQTGELSAYDNHPGDVATELFERGKDLSLGEHAEREKAKLENALKRLADGSYGLCVVCGRPIPYERLEAMPEADRCVEHAADHGEPDRRPAEERVLAPPFGRTSLDERTEQSRFDGEDAWQIVDSWGTSNSPAMAENRDVADYGDVSIEADETEGFVEPLENFVATDIYGENVSVVRSRAYFDYLARGEGEFPFERLPDSGSDEDGAAE